MCVCVCCVRVRVCISCIVCCECRLVSMILPSRKAGHEPCVFLASSPSPIHNRTSVHDHSYSGPHYRRMRWHAHIHISRTPTLLPHAPVSLSHARILAQQEPTKEDIVLKLTANGLRLRFEPVGEALARGGDGPDNANPA